MEKQTTNLGIVFDASVKTAGSVEIPRCYFGKEEPTAVSIQLHGFSDASSYAYAAAVYRRIELESGVKPVLVASKKRIATLSGQTMPRLELLGSVI